MNIAIRNIEDVSELVEVKALESIIWSMDDPVPVHHMAAVIKSGGLVLGAFLNERLIGFQYSFAGFDGKKAYLHSHNLGIHPDFRKLGIGMQLKLAQKETAIQKGYDLIKWTYDPLETVNGTLNLHKLGATCQTYIEDAYGDLPDQLNAGLPSDRFLVEWDLTKEKPEASSASCTSVMTTNTMNGYLTPGEMTFDQTDDWLSIPVPINFQELKKNDLPLARNWREATRALFQHYFSNGYRTIDLIRDSSDGNACHYLLKKQ
ncbi:GNAT family N-acetyltransferase [bacterium LRH843]|nr:GNAT family N-acetyltransferase [bacterium LRH843]